MIRTLAGVAVLLIGALQLAGAQKPALVLTGVLTGADNQTYKEVAFSVPQGVTRLDVEFSYTGREQHTVIDLGIFDGERFRGWSGGNKDRFTLSATDATPSFLIGPIRPGRWFLLLGVPNIRPGVESRYTAKIHFGRKGGDAGEGFPATPAIRTGPAWYRGDLHMHTGHSDGSCLSQSGVRVPCPVFRTVQAAVDRGLDFISITDHNTNSQAGAIRELQPFFDRMLLIAGREITTFQGHSNVFGPVDFIDFRLGSKAVPRLSVLQDEVKALHGLISVNHPASVSGEACLGCGWTAETDYRRMDAVEAVNGDGAEAAIPFWNELLNRGFRITGIGGSDNHDADKAANQGGIGTPETVVYAGELSQEAILNGIRAGHVFLDLEGTGDRLLECVASTARQKAAMGDVLAAAAGEKVALSVHVAGAAGDSVELIEDGKVRGGRVAGSNDSTVSFDWTGDGARHWVRVVVRTAEGRALLIGNPVYINF